MDSAPPVHDADHGVVDYGCSYLLWLSVVVVAGIVINGAVVDLLLAQFPLERSVATEEPPLESGIRKTGPFLLLVAEFWVLDFFVDRWRRRRKSR